MAELNWFVYQGGVQIGPFSIVTLKEKLEKKEVTLEGFLFKTGWKDWRPVGDCLQEIGSATNMVPPPPNHALRPPRATIQGQVIVHNDGQLIIGRGVNISSSGIFIETSEMIFKVGEVLKLTCRVDGFYKSFNAQAEVIRFNSDPSSPIGYGLRFTTIDTTVQNQIDKTLRSNGFTTITRGA